VRCDLIQNAESPDVALQTAAASLREREVPRSDAPTLIVTVDTEEDGAWDGAFRAHGNTVRNLRGLRRFQDCCGRYGVRPTHLVDTPVLADDAAVEMLGDFQDTGRCEVGAHLHPWCAPPLEESPDAKTSFMCNLPERLQREKLTRLTDEVERRFGRRPTSFRAGRYGLDAAGARILGELGYVVDSSVISFLDYSARGGPDFRRAPYQPYRIGGADLLVEDAAGTVLEVPISVGFSRPGFRRAQRIREWAEAPVLRPLRLVGILDRLNLVRRIKLSPEQADAKRMCRLVDAYLAEGARCVVMMLHSVSLVAGCSPYVADAPALERLYDDLIATWEHCLSVRGMTTRTLTEFATEQLQTTR